MGQFFRYIMYEEKRKNLERAFNKDEAAYCNPQDYFVTEDECRQYLIDLEKGYQANKELNFKRKSVPAFTCRAFLHVFLVILFLLLIYFNLFAIPELIDSGKTYPSENPSTIVLFFRFALGFVVLYLLAAYPIGICYGIYSLVNEIIENSFCEVYYLKCYPKTNENIEKLFDDYLWKCNLIKKAESNEQKKKTNLL